MGRMNKTGRPKRRISMLNSALAAGILIWGGRVAVRYATGPVGEPETVMAQTSQNVPVTAEQIPDIGVKPLNIYLDGIAQRDLFTDKESQPPADNTMLPVAIPALEQKIKLIGILVDADSKAIVEDLQEKQTHFLSRGDSIGQVLLEEIREDKAIFMYNKTRYEMSL